MPEMLLEKYKPQNIGNIVANAKGAYDLLSFAKNWKKGSFAVITGPPGCGKSLSLELVAKEMQCSVVEGTIEEVTNASAEQSLLMRDKLLVLDIDGPPDMPYTKYFALMKRLVEKSTWPLFFMTNDIYADGLWRFRKAFGPMKLIRFFPPFESTLVRHLENVCRSEGLRYERSALEIIAKISEGDVRFAMLALESMPKVTTYFANTISRDGIHNIYSTLDSVFTGKGVPDGQDKNILNIVSENLPEVYKDKELVYAYRCVALSEWFSRRIKNNLHFLKALPKAPPQRRRYTFPKQRKAQFPSEIARALHCSVRKAVAYKPVLKKIGVL